jgi:hypothetical protein
LPGQYLSQSPPLYTVGGTLGRVSTPAGDEGLQIPIVTVMAARTGRYAVHARRGGQLRQALPENKPIGVPER